MRIALLFVLAAGLLGVGFALAQPGGPDPDGLAAPVEVRVDGKPIDWTIGPELRPTGDNSCPWVGDFDGDGKPDLLIGQHGRGKSGEGHLRIYRNLADKGAPRLAAPIWFDDRVPTGRIPSG